MALREFDVGVVIVSLKRCRCNPGGDALRNFILVHIDVFDLVEMICVAEFKSEDPRVLFVLISAEIDLDPVV